MEVRQFHVMLHCATNLTGLFIATMLNNSTSEVNRDNRPLHENAAKVRSRGSEQCPNLELGCYSLRAGEIVWLRGPPTSVVGSGRKDDWPTVALERAWHPWSRATRPVYSVVWFKGGRRWLFETLFAVSSVAWQFS